jgi:hypothetical protein
MAFYCASYNATLSMNEDLKCLRKPENTYDEEIFLLHRGEVEAWKTFSFFWVIETSAMEESRSEREMPQNNRKRIFYDRMRHQNMLRCWLSSSTRRV